jgi:AraC-like DNA-binding protein
MISRVPAPPLSDLVAVLWYAEGWKPPHRRERHMPDGSAGLIVSLGDGVPGRSGPRAIVSGPRSEAFVMKAVNTVDTIIGAQFTHCGAAAFLDVPLSDLRNTHVSLMDLVGRSGSLLRERLLELSTAEARLDFLESWLRQRMLRRPGPNEAIVWATRQLRGPSTRVADVTAQIGRSSRWFIDRFARDVGLTPKVFSRVQRFQAALRLARPRVSVDLADLAAAAGYFDQAHLTHEFTRLAGLSPSVLFAGRTDFLNHVVDAD